MVKLGDRVEEDDKIADVMTDKATVEMESPVSGVIVSVAGGEGDMLAMATLEKGSLSGLDPETAEVL